MRKTYTKPEIMFEGFAMSTSIAAGCEVITNSTYGICHISTRDGNLFTMGADSTCDTAPQTADGTFSSNGYDNLCYHIPQPSANVFNS